MPFQLTNPSPISIDHFEITGFSIFDFQKKIMSINYINFDADGNRVGRGAVTLIDSEGITDFSDFYNTWTTQEQLYAKVAELKGLEGTYSDDNGFV